MIQPSRRDRNLSWSFSDGNVPAFEMLGRNHRAVELTCKHVDLLCWSSWGTSASSIPYPFRSITMFSSAFTSPVSWALSRLHASRRCLACFVISSRSHFLVSLNEYSGSFANIFSMFFIVSEVSEALLSTRDESWVLHPKFPCSYHPTLPKSELLQWLQSPDSL